ncbi:MAG: lipopolysaccharide heptosyltransferase II [Nitrospinae bacterium]|nr:lipopolysaccharide heptosyltransferase II [Nitrospinota bacterium]MBF0633160.1 lipopolysaccharide heptosyltransferase II [Nitrospinota bacterium]
MKLPVGSIRKILVLRYRSIGDILLANPALHGLRRTFPMAKIDVLVDDLFGEILRGNPNVDRAILNPRKPAGPKWKADLEMVKKLRSEEYDLAVDLHSGPRSAAFAFLSGAKWRAGHAFRLRNRLSYNVPVTSATTDEHTWKVQFKVVAELGVAWPVTPEYFLSVSDEMANSVNERLKKAGFSSDHPLVLLHPGARVMVKRWPADRMGELARWLVDEKGAAVFLAGAPADEDEIRKIRKASGYALPYFTDLNMGELIALIKRSAMIVCNDSGPMHIAGVLNIPTVALFGPSDPHVWAPVGEKKVVLTCAPMECMPCDQKHCPYEGNHCMTRISVDEVKREVGKLGALG